MGSSNSSESKDNPKSSNTNDLHDRPKNSPGLGYTGSAKRAADRLVDNMESVPPSSSSPDPLVPAHPEEKEKNVQMSKLNAAKALLYAAQKGDAALIRAALSQGADINTTDEVLLLEQADKEKDKDNEKENEKENESKSEDKEKANNKKYSNIYPCGDTALHMVCEFGHSNCIALLFFAGANVEAKNRFGSTSLHRAVAANQLNAVVELMSKGAKLDEVNGMHNNVLHIAAYGGYNEILNYFLVNHGAARLLFLKNRAGLIPFDYARKNSSIELIKKFQKIEKANHALPSLDLHGPSFISPTHNNNSNNNNNNNIKNYSAGSNSKRKGGLNNNDLTQQVVIEEETNPNTQGNADPHINVNDATATLNDIVVVHESLDDKPVLPNPIDATSGSGSGSGSGSRTGLGSGSKKKSNDTKSKLKQSNSRSQKT